MMDPMERDEMLYGGTDDWVESDQVLTQDDAARRWRRAQATQTRINEIRGMFDAERRRLEEREAEVVGPLARSRDILVSHVEQWHRSYVADGGTPTINWPAGGRTLVKKAGQPELVIEDEDELMASAEALDLVDTVFPKPPPAPPPVGRLHRKAVRDQFVPENPKAEPGAKVRLVHAETGTVIKGAHLVPKPKEFHPTMEAMTDDR